MTLPLFLYGPLCHAPLRAEVLGTGHSVEAAALSGYRLGRVAGSGLPALVPGEGAVPGLLVSGLDATARARADFFAAVLGYEPAEVEMRLEDRWRRLVAAYLFLAGPVATGPVETGPVVNGPVATDGGWDRDAWIARLGDVWASAAVEVMAGMGDESPAAMAVRWPTMCMRAATRIRAARDTGAEIRADLTAARDVEILAHRTPYTEYFSLEDPDLRFRRFNGAWSNRVRRAAFVGGDAVSVLPYDPVQDAVLMVEQFRTGPLVRGDPRPWSLEPIAGRIDPGEAPEDTARREAQEESGLALGALHKVAEYYPSPGAVTEYLYSFVAEADLAGFGGRIGGEAGEDEDIRSHVVPFDRLMALIDSGEAGTGPLILSIYWLALNRTRLRS
ncbi:MAG: NUDIX domain-containing protein [Maritimibacter sp.]|nr:NUDIX domain-containing protein [Maritimibacter sp.]